MLVRRRVAGQTDEYLFAAEWNSAAFLSPLSFFVVQPRQNGEAFAIRPLTATNAVQPHTQDLQRILTAAAN